MEPPSKKIHFDWLSHLPDNIIHSILPLLPIQDIARVSTMSRRMRQLCFSMPDLNLDLQGPMNEQKSNCFLGFMERFWPLHNGTDLFHLRISLQPHQSLKYNVEHRIVTWMHNAIVCRVQELSLDIAMKSFLKLPNSEFKSLQDLSLKLFASENPQLGEWISSYCKAIINLSIEAFRGVPILKIKRSLQHVIVKSEAEELYTLSIFVLQSISVTWWFRGCYMGRPFIISAPNLVKLKYEGDLAVFHGQVEFKYLQSA